MPGTRTKPIPIRTLQQVSRARRRPCLRRTCRGRRRGHGGARRARRGVGGVGPKEPKSRPTEDCGAGLSEGGDRGGYGPVQRGQCAGSVIAGPSTRGHAGGHVRRDEAVRSEHVGGDRFPTVPKTWHPDKNPARHDRVPGAVAGQAVQASAVAQSHQKRWASRADWASSAQSSSSAASVMP